MLRLYCTMRLGDKDDAAEDRRCVLCSGGMASKGWERRRLRQSGLLLPRLRQFVIATRAVQLSIEMLQL